MSMQTAAPVVVYVRAVAAIPVGHRVEVIVLRYFDWKALEQPLITDLDTGITYGELSYFLPRATAGSHRPLTNLLPELNEHERWTGKVLICQVLREQFGVHGGMVENFQTTLVIAVDPPVEQPYR